MLKSKKKPSLADKINDIIADGPKTFDSDDEPEETKARVVDQYSDSDSDDARTKSSTTLRKRNVNLLDESDARYEGKKMSRKDIFGEENSKNNEDDDLESGEDSEEALEDLSAEEEEEEEGDDVVEDDEDEEDNDEDLESGDDENYSDNSEESDFDESNPLRRAREDDNNFPSMTPRNVLQEVEKGNCVRNQLKMHEYLLEMRIQLQKCLSTSNKMPQYDTIKKIRSDKPAAKALDELKTKWSHTLENLLELQSKLWKNNSETKNLLSNKNNKIEKKIEQDPMDEEIASDTEDEMEQDQSENEESEDEESKEPAIKKRKTLAEFENILDERHRVYRPYRNSVIQKWNDKTRVATGNANKGSSQAVVKQIEFILNDKQKMIKRTQLKRSEYEIVGKASKDENDEDGRRTQEYDTEIYDDDDFYHQLLRELIEQKSADITDPIQLSKQWIQLQNMRNKMKRKIDTRATKGRRVRYNVHSKLVNFMAPNTVSDTWSDLAKTELYNSLFGKIKLAENNTKNDI